MNARFPPEARVRARAEFDQAFKDGKRTASPLFALHHRPDDRLPRLGLAVSRKVDPHAVGRNRIKRVLRDCFRQLRADLGHGSYVVVARNLAAKTDNEALRTGFMTLLQRAGTLPAIDGAVTIPRASTVQSPCKAITQPLAEPSDGSRPAVR